MIQSKREGFVARSTIVVILIMTLIPFLNMLSASLQPATSTPLGLSFPRHPQWSNFKVAFEGGHVWQLMRSSSSIVLVVVPLTLVFATLCGYAIAHLRVRGRNLIFLGLLLGLTIPFESLIIPLYYEVDSLGILNTQWALIFPLIGLFMPFSVIWMRAHFVQIPKELAEAARVDGASAWQEFRRIQLPLAIPSISALALLVFLWTWNQFILGVVLIDDPLKRTVAGALTFFQGQYYISIPLINAGALIIIMPTILIFIIFQRQFIKALLQGAVKG